MTDTTIAISKEFHDWLKSKGTKGDSYEDIIKKVIRADYLQDLEDGHEYIKVKKAAKLKKEKISRKKADKKPVGKKIVMAKKPVVKQSSAAKKQTSKPAEAGKEIKEWKANKNLELQRLKVEFELAKLSDNEAKMKDLSTQIAKLKGDLDKSKSR